MAVTSTNIVKAALASLTIDSVDVGGTYAPLTVSVEVTRQDIIVEQLLTAIRSVITARNVTAATTLAEITLANMAIVWQLPSSLIVSSSLTINASSDRGDVTWVAVGLAGTAPGATPTTNKRTFNFPRSRSNGTITTNLAKLEDGALPAEWVFLANSTTGIIGTVTDSAA
jgi:hypothetical protein